MNIEYRELSPLNQFMNGFLAPARGIGLILGNKRVLRLAVLPFFLTLIILIAGLATGLPIVTGWVTPATTSILAFFGLASSNFLSWVFPVFLWPAFAIALLYILWVITRVLAAPLFSLLAERALIEGGVIPDLPFNLKEWLRLSGRMFVVSISRALFLGIIGVILFVLSFIPLVGVLTTLCFLMIVASDLLDYSLEALQLGFRERVNFLKRSFFVLFGLGVALGLVFFVPGLNFFLLPASVVGASDAVKRAAVLRA